MTTNPTGRRALLVVALLGAGIGAVAGASTFETIGNARLAPA
jgi:hypothetical protein